MKIILSRKGFDSNTGGITSPIFENGDMVSFPIPEHIVNHVKDDNYRMLHYGNRDYSVLLENLGYCDNQKCHIDPDLSQDNRIEKIRSWVPIFGQCDQAASHLVKTANIKEGDIFLFFGNFHHVCEQNGKFKVKRSSGDFYQDNDLQVIWGYLQVGKVVTKKEEQEKYFWHPHAFKYYTDKSLNVMFIARESLTFNEKIPGYGVLKYRKDRVLTEKNHSKANWKKRSVYDVDSILGSRKNSSNSPNETIYYRGQWQELCLKETKESTEWVKKIIESNPQ